MSTTTPETPEPAFIEICNWRRAQAQMPKLGATWAKLYTSLLDHEGFSRLAARDQLGLIALWLVAARTGRHILPADPEWLLTKADFLHEAPDLAALASATDAWGRPCPFVRFVGAGSETGDETGSAGPEQGATKPVRHAVRLCECGQPLAKGRRVCDACKKARSESRRARSRKRPERAHESAPSTRESALNAPRTRPGARSAGKGARSAKSRSGRKSRSVGVLQKGGALAGAPRREEQRRGEEIREEKKPESYQAAPPFQDFTQIPEREEPEQRGQADQPEKPASLTKPEATRPGAVYGPAGPSAPRLGLEPIGNVIKLYWSDPASVAFGVAMAEILTARPIGDVRGESNETKSLVGAFAKLFWAEVKPVVTAGGLAEFIEKARAKARHAKKYGKPPGRLLTAILRKQLLARGPPQAAKN